MVRSARRDAALSDESVRATERGPRGRRATRANHQRYKQSKQLTVTVTGLEDLGLTSHDIPGDLGVRIRSHQFR